MDGKDTSDDYKSTNDQNNNNNGFGVSDDDIMYYGLVAGYKIGEWSIDDARGKNDYYAQVCDKISEYADAFDRQFVPGDKIAQLDTQWHYNYATSTGRITRASTTHANSRERR